MGDTVKILDSGDMVLTTQITGIEMNRGKKEKARIGEYVGVLLRGADRSKLKVGQVIAK